MGAKSGQMAVYLRRARCVHYRKAVNSLWALCATSRRGSLIVGIVYIYVCIVCVLSAYSRGVVSMCVVLYFATTSLRTPCFVPNY